MKVSSNEWNAEDVAEFLRDALIAAHPRNRDLDSAQPVKESEKLDAYPTGTFGPPQRIRLVVGSHRQEFLVTVEQRF